MSEIGLLISVDDRHKDRLSEVVEHCEKLGLKVEQRLDAIGVVTGSIDSANVDAIRQIEGVSSVEPSREIRIAPPGSKLQ
jgi:hypothetical protein